MNEGGVGAGGVHLWQLNDLPGETYTLGDNDMGAAYVKPCNGGNFQNWTMNWLYVDQTTGFVVWQIVDDETGNCLDGNVSAGFPSNTDMGAVYTKTCNGGPYQEWGGGQNSYGTSFENVGADGKCLTTEDPSEAIDDQDPAADPEMSAVFLTSCSPGGDTWQSWFRGTWGQ